MPYPTKALQEYVLKSDLKSLAGVVGITGPVGPPGAPGAAGASWTPVQSVTAPATANNGTIATVGITVSRVAPTAAVTGVVLAAGTIAGQQVVVLNESAFSITFGTLGSSNVSIGVNCMIPAGTHLQFVWNSATGRWYPSSVGSLSTPPASITFSGAIKFPMFKVTGVVNVPPPPNTITGAIKFPMFKVAGTVSVASGSGAYGAGQYGIGSYGL